MEIKRINKIFLTTVIILAFICFCFRSNVLLYFTAEGYQAVFLDNGQVYFGKLSSSGKWLKLSDVYYLQTTKQLQQDVLVEVNANQNVQLIKLGSELHGPADIMYITKDKVLFWENIKDGSKVAQAIKDYQAKAVEK